MMGAIRSARPSDTTSDADSVKASARKKKPVTPVKSASGRNTTTVVAVEAIIARVSCDIASEIVSSIGMSGRSRRLRATFSMTTIASSMMSPTATARPPTLMRLSVWPDCCMARIAIDMASGMTAAATSVNRKLRKNA